MSESSHSQISVKGEPSTGLPQNQAHSDKNAISKKAKGSRPSTRKTIKGPGSLGMRSAQACDRCRAKKSRCDGKQPACSSCAAAGLECVVSDRLTRKSYPKGYTELLEEQARQLIAENARLKGALTLRDEQLASYSGSAKNGSISQISADLSAGATPAAGGEKLQEFVDLSNPHSVLHSHSHEDGCSCCNDSSAVHERPVSVAGSVFDAGIDDRSIQGSVYSDFDDEFDDDLDVLSIISDESPQGYEPGIQYKEPRDLRGPSPDYYNGQVRPAPGAFAAATAIEQMQKKRALGNENLNEESKEHLLTGLVAASIPRSTEETLFIPTLLARICEAYGYSSAPARLTASAIASLKDTPALSPVLANKKTNNSVLLSLIINNDSAQLSERDAAVMLRHMNLPHKAELDRLLGVYFQEWGSVVPIVNKNAFLKNYVRFAEILETGSSNILQQYFYESTEKLGALVVLAIALAMLSEKSTFKDARNANVSDHSANLVHFDTLIHEFIKPNCILTRNCSLQSLQILALALHYCLATGDYLTCYELRGRVITMAQQLRLHRCPAAVLGLSKEMNDRDMKAFMQGERRTVFWCIYVLDVYSSLNLGVPRLLKDYEIECATPFSGKTDNDDDERDNENILIVNNTKLTIFGKVSRISLCLMQFCKVLGNIMDMIFSRSGNYNVYEKALEKDQMLDCWRRDLPVDLRFDSNMHELSLNGSNSESEGVSWGSYNRQQFLLIFLYHHAKILIYLPIISKYGYHHNVGLSMKEKLATGKSDISTNVSSMTLIQQSASQILHLLKNLSTANPHVLPVPLNISREHARFAILVAKGSLDYIKGGPLHQQSKQLLLETIPILKNEALMEIPGSLTKRSASLLEYAVLSVMGLNLGRVAGGNNLRKRIITNESMSRAGSNRSPASSGMSPAPDKYFLKGKSYDAPIISGINSLSTNSTEPQHNSAFGLENSHVHPSHLPSQQNEFNSASLKDVFRLHTPSPGPFQQNSTADFQEIYQEPFDERTDFFKFDELIANFGNNIPTGDLVTDGSLGLVPFLNEPNDYGFTEGLSNGGYGGYGDGDYEMVE